MPKQRAVVIIPTHNERQSIAEIIARVLAQQVALPDLDLNVLIVDGASDDGTIALVSDLSHEDERVHLLLVPRRGLGIAMQRGYEYALRELGAQYVAQMDADLSHSPAMLPQILGALTAGYDIAIGSRYVDGGGTVDWPVSRRIESMVANRFAAITSGYREVREWTSGYRAFTAAIYNRMQLDAIRHDDYTIQAAFLLAALGAGAIVKEVPIVFVNRKWGKSKLPLFRYTLNLTKHFLRARLVMARRTASRWRLRALP